MTRPPPLILVVSGDEVVRQQLVHDIAHRFGADYTVAAAATTDAALDRLGSQASSGAATALVIVDERLGNPPPSAFLRRVHQLEPEAKRILLIERGNYSSRHPVVTVMALGEVDYHLFDPWFPLERILYPGISEFLAAWDTSQDAHKVAVRIVGRPAAARSHQVRDLLTRAAVPFWFHEPETEAGRQALAEAGEDGTRLPVMLFYSGTILVDPSNADVIEELGMTIRPSSTSCDLVVLGAGPAGLAAAVYAASEGLRTMVVEPEVPGGQAGTSSLIRNYLGFRHGVSGEELAGRASEQAWLFGADIVLAQRGTKLELRGDDRIVHISDGSAVAARAVVLATGVTWRRLDIPSLEALVGAGVFYGAAGAATAKAKSRTSRVYLLPESGKNFFGLNEVVLTMKDSKAAGKLVDRIKSKLSSCKTVKLTASVTKPKKVTGIGAQKTKVTGWTTVVSQKSTQGTAKYRVGIVAAGSKVTYTFLNPRGDYDFSNRQWNTVAVRAGQRATQVNE